MAAATPAATCDQRLLASKVSTDLGYLGYLAFPAIVINAYWHQRFQQYFSSDPKLLRLNCDQRLLASKVSTVPFGLHMSALGDCDQRLLASKVSTDGAYHRGYCENFCDQRLLASKVSTVDSPPDSPYQREA